MARTFLFQGDLECLAERVPRYIRPGKFADYSLYDSFVPTKAVIYTKDGIDHPSKGWGQFQILLKSGLVGMDRMNILQRANESRESLKRRGAHVWGAHQLPLGIAYHRKTLTYSLTPEIAKVQEAFRLIDEEGIDNIREISDRLGLHERRLHRMLRNPLYAGYQVHEFTRANQPIVSKRGKPYHVKIPLPEEQKIKVKVMEEPAIPEERWKRVQQILSQKGKAWKAQHKVGPLGNLLRGLTWCSECGSKLYLQADHRRPTIMGYFKCSKERYENGGKYKGCGARNQRQSTLQEVTTQFIAEFLNEPSTVKAIIQHAAATKVATLEESMPDDLSVDNPGSIDWEDRGRRLDKLFEMGRLSATQLAERIAQLEKEKAAFEVRQKAKESAQHAIHQKKLLDTTAARLVRGARAFRRITNPDWKHKALKGLFKEIHYKDCRITAFKPREDIFPEAELGHVCESRRGSDWGSIFADMLVVLLKPFPPLEKGAVSVPEGYGYAPAAGI